MSEIEVGDRVRIGKGKAHWRVHRLYNFGGSEVAEVTTLLGKRGRTVRVECLTKITEF